VVDLKQIKPLFFARPDAFHRWLSTNHAKKSEQWVGFHKKGTGKPSLTWPESVDEALCYGWIDGVRRSIDAESYMIRFTPRKPRSVWSNVNTRRAQELIDEGRMQPAGLKAFEARDPERAGIYSFEREQAAFTPQQEKRFRANRKAWKFFESQPPGYRRLATHWVTSARQEATRERRLDTLIADSAEGQRIAQFRR
jgi:uncharacterized protein YdeI (YjbR/CyaY-like superfamily)